MSPVVTPTTRRKHRAGIAGLGQEDPAAQCLLTRMETADQKGDRRYNRMAGALKFISLELQNLAAAVKEVKDDVAYIRATSTMASAHDLFIFPLKNEQDVMDYLEKDPSMRHLMER